MQYHAKTRAFEISKAELAAVASFASTDDRPNISRVALHAGTEALWATNGHALLSISTEAFWPGVSGSECYSLPLSAVKSILKRAAASDAITLRCQDNGEVWLHPKKSEAFRLNETVIAGGPDGYSLPDTGHLMTSAYGDMHGFQDGNVTYVETGPGVNPSYLLSMAKAACDIRGSYKIESNALRIVGSGSLNPLVVTGAFESKLDGSATHLTGLIMPIRLK